MGGRIIRQVRLDLVVAALVLGACTIGPAEPKIVAATPASVELSCISDIGSCRSAQAVADAAQAHCQRYGLNAQERMVNRAPSGNEIAVFDCVAAGTAAAQGQR